MKEKRKFTPLLCIWIVLAILAIIAFCVSKQVNEPRSGPCINAYTPVGVKYQDKEIELSDEQSEELYVLTEQFCMDGEEAAEIELEDCYEIVFKVGCSGYLATEEKRYSRSDGQLWAYVDDELYNQLLQFMEKVME